MNKNCHKLASFVITKKAAAPKNKLLEIATLLSWGYVQDFYNLTHIIYMRCALRVYALHNYAVQNILRLELHKTLTS